MQRQPGITRSAGTAPASGPSKKLLHATPDRNASEWAVPIDALSSSVCGCLAGSRVRSDGDGFGAGLRETTDVGLRAGAGLAHGSWRFQAGPRASDLAHEVSEGGVSARALSIHHAWNGWAFADDAADRPRSQVKHGVGPASGAGRIHSIRLAKSARRPASISRVVPLPDGGRERSGGSAANRRSSEGPANQLDQHA